MSNIRSLVKYHQKQIKTILGTCKCKRRIITYRGGGCRLSEVCKVTRSLLRKYTTNQSF